VPTDGAPLRVAMIGHRFMGATHSQAWRVAPHFFDLPRGIDMALVVGRNRAATEAAANQLGWREAATDWRDAVTREDIDLVDICAPSNVHAEIAIAALATGKHVLCEKPLANTVDEAEAMASAAQQARDHGAFAMVGFTYRRVPAIELMRQIVLGGEIGEIRQVRAQYLQDWLANPAAPMSWRLDRDVAGSGALGDLGSNIVDAVQFITEAHFTQVSAVARTFVDERPWPGSDTAAIGRVTVDDATVFLGLLDGGAVATFEATRMASGRKNALRIEVSGSTGAVAFDLEELNYLQYFRSDDGPRAGFRRILVTEPEHPRIAAWWPPGHLLGYEHAFTHQVVDLIDDIQQGRQPRPSFADGWQVQQVLDAVDRSSATRAWAAVPAPGERSADTQQLLARNA
jgi:predicted dehydrogenase